VGRASDKRQAARWLRHYQELPEQQRGLIITALLANAIVTIIVKTALAVAGIRAIRRSWRAWRLGPASALRAGLGPALGVAVAANLAHWAVRTWAIHALDAGRGQVWLERMDRWLDDRAEASSPGPHGPAAGRPSG